MPTIVARVPVKATIDKEALLPNARAMRRLEDDATERLYTALQKWGRALFRDVTADSVALLTMRLDDPEFNKPMRDALIAVLQDVAEAGVEHGRKQIETAVYGVKRTTARVDPGMVDWTAANVDAAEWATTYGYELIQGITSTTRAHVAGQVRYFVDNSITVNQLRDRLMEGAMFSKTRAGRIATTETTRAFAEGNTAAWDKSGLTQGREWYTANDELVCKICGPLHGTIAKPGEWFRGMYRNPPAHVGCRCLVLPVVVGDDEEFGGMWRFDQVQRDQWSGVPVGAMAQVGRAATGARALDTLEIDVTDEKLRAELTEAANAIDAAHALPANAVPNIRVIGDEQYAGVYQRNAITGAGEHIAVASDRGSGFAFVHEYGHHLDDQWLRVTSDTWGGNSDPDDEYIDRFWDAVSKSRQGKRLDDMYYESDNPSPYLQYLSSGKEKWARAYSQYVTVKSKNPALLAQLKAELEMPFAFQWEADDFDAIYDAIDALLTNKVKP